MALDESLSPDITERLPVGFSGNPTGGVPTPPTLVQSDAQWDVGIGDQAFLLAASKDNPYRRESADVSKQQLDTSKEPGEQTLNQWWLRSQTSWHHGSGINFYEPGSDEGATQYRFAEAYGVDIWTQGQVSLLHKMDGATGQAGGATDASSTPAVSATAVVNGENVAVLLHAGRITIASGVNRLGTTHSYINIGNAVAIGAKVYFGHSLGISVFDAAAGTLVNVWTQLSGPTPLIGWVKSRFMAAFAHQLYELPLAGGAIGSQTPYYTHPDTNWRWTGIGEAPAAILTCGNSGALGAVHRITLDPGTGGATPTLSSPEQIAELPPGETIHSIFNYLGNYVALGTARGIRIGTFDAYYGFFTYGPLSVETAEPVYALTARDRYCYGAVTNGILGKSGVVRMDLSQQVAENRYAWSWDVQTHTTGKASSLAFVGDRLVVGIDGWGHYIQSPTQYEPMGWITSGKIRFGTSESKSFRLAKLRATTNSGAVTLFAVSPSGDRNVLSLTNATNTNEDIDISSSIAPTEYASFRLQLAPDTAGISSPVVEALSIKALPAVRRQRLIQYPLMCFNRESDRYGVSHGYEGAAWARLAALEELEESQAVIMVQDFTSGETFQATIEKLQFTREASPKRKLDNFGGIVLATVRKLL